MNPSEASIFSAVDKLKSSPGKFQRLVERYAQLTDVSLFKDLIPKGRNPADVTTKGWPDAYALLPDGRMAVAEATHSPKWRKHVKEDLEKATALGHGRLAGFLFISWAKTPSDQVVQGYRQCLVNLGVPVDNIRFVFQQQLVRDLTQPRFATIWADPLHIQTHCRPFYLIQNAGIFGRSGQLDVFAPTIEEYRSNWVHRPGLADEVEQDLGRRGWALVRGLGAAGKTVLAAQVALDGRYHQGPAYYLDLAGFAREITELDRDRAFETITRRGDEHVLFIVDNIHLDEKYARDVFNHWQEISSGSQLLLLGRWVALGPDARGRARPFDDLESETRILQAGPADLAGVFQRLLRRISTSSARTPNPPDEVLQHWSTLFGGDLIAFCAAVARRASRLIEGDWQLSAEDAAAYVRETYLDLEPVSEAERRNLLYASVLVTLEYDIPKSALETAAFDHALKTGLIHRLERGREKHVYFHLIHPGIGLVS